jgi:DHA1 family multidrug resistance protein-like MFS transporter
MLADTLLMWGGFFMVIPLIAIHYVDGLGWDAAAIGLVLALRQLVQQGFTVGGGMLADRMGARGLIAVGMLIRAGSFMLMAYADTFPLLLISAILAAIGGALFDSPSSAAIAALTTPEDRNRFYAVLGVVRGLGMALGPLIGAFLIHSSFTLVALAAGGSFLLAFFVTLLLMPPVRVATSEREDLTYGLRLAVRDRPFVLFNLLLMGYYFLWVQITIALPLRAQAISGTSDAVSWIYLLNAVMSIVMQYPLLRLAERWLRPMPILILGVVLMAIGLGSVALADSIPMLLFSVALFSMGGLLSGPTQQTLLANLANPAALGSYFGASALALAFGGGIGNFSGGLLYSFGQQLNMPALPWLVFLIVGVSTALGLSLFARSNRRREAQEEQRNRGVVNQEPRTENRAPGTQQIR